MKRLKTIATAAMALVGVATGAMASESAALVDKLVEKGVLTESEADEVKASLAEEVAGTGYGKMAGGKLAKKINLFGDLRLRYEYSDSQVAFDDHDHAGADVKVFRSSDNLIREVRAVGNNSNGNATNSDSIVGTTTDGRQDNSRVRYRLRFGMNVDFSEKLQLGFRLATGTNADITSTNETMGDNFAKDDITVDQAYLKWTPFDWVTLWGGKHEVTKAIWTTDMIWDGDITVEGATQNFKWKANDNLSLFANTAQWVFQDVAEADETENMQTLKQNRYIAQTTGGARRVYKVTEKLRYNEDGTVEDMTVRNETFTVNGRNVAITGSSTTGEVINIEELGLADVAITADNTNMATEVVEFGDVANSWAQESNDDAWMFGGQVGAQWDFTPKRTYAKVAAGYWYFANAGDGATIGQPMATTNTSAITAGTSNLGSEFHLVDVLAEFKYTPGSGILKDIPIKPYGHVVINTAPAPDYLVADSFGNATVRVASNDGPGESLAGNSTDGTAYGEVKNTRDMSGNLGWRAGLQLGEAKKRGQWEINAYYQQTGTDATPDMFNDADFGSGATNTQGYVIKAAYAFRDWWTFGVNYIDTDFLNADIPQDYNQTYRGQNRTVQFDTMVKF